MAEKTEPQSAEGVASAPAPAPKPGVLQSPMFKRIAIIVSVLLVLGGIVYYLHSRQFEDTDDGEIDGHISPVSSRVSGTVRQINGALQDNRYVTAGTLLVEIDPTDYGTEVSRADADYQRLLQNAAASTADVPVVTANATGQFHVAQAQLASAAEAVQTEKANREAVRARLNQAEATFKTAEDDRQRYSNLLAKQEISRSEYDQRATTAHNANQAVDVSRADLRAADERIAQAESKVAEQRAQVERAQSAPGQISEARQKAGSAGADMQRAAAMLKTAQLNLSYTRIVAPVSGIVGRRAVEVGQRVQQGQELFEIIQTDDIWVTANFKETQLRAMRPGQAATVHVDTYDLDFEGKVESIAAATGARFSLLPPENATGNFVKVVQRLPVRIRFNQRPNDAHPLRPGMSADVSVKVR
jgi:membrane fusion protein (multidrug efflux system)